MVGKTIRRCEASLGRLRRELAVDVFEKKPLLNDLHHYSRDTVCPLGSGPHPPQARNRGIVGGPYTTRISPGAWLDPYVHRRIISEASAEDNREIVRYATVAWGIYRSPGGLIETSPITRLTLCLTVRFKVSFTL
jgi:hypothetical protein